MITPELLADDCDRRATRTILTGLEATTDSRFNAQSSKEICAHGNTRHSFGRTQSAEREAACTSLKHCNVLEAVLLITPRKKICHTHGIPSGASALVHPDGDQLTRFRIGQRA